MICYPGKYFAVNVVPVIDEGHGKRRKEMNFFGDVQTELSMEIEFAKIQLPYQMTKLKRL